MKILLLILSLVSLSCTRVSWENVDFQLHMIEENAPPGEPLTTPERERLREILDRNNQNDSTLVIFKDSKGNYHADRIEDGAWVHVYGEGEELCRQPLTTTVERKK